MHLATGSSVQLKYFGALRIPKIISSLTSCSIRVQSAQVVLGTKDICWDSFKASDRSCRNSHTWTSQDDLM